MKKAMLVATLAGCVSDPVGDGKPGGEGGPCFDNGTCNAGLVCVVPNQCVRLDGGQEDSAIHDAATAKDVAAPKPGVCGLPPFYSNACQPCANTSCCTQQQQCAQDPDCNAYALCILECGRVFGCPAPSCESGCGGTYAAGYQKFNSGVSVDSCVYSKCGSSCATSCPP